MNMFRSSCVASFWPSMATSTSPPIRIRRMPATTARFPPRKPARSAGPPGVTRSINRPASTGRSSASAQRADYAGGEGALEAEGVADSERALADLQRARIAQRQHGELPAARLNLDQGDIVALVGADEFRRVAGLIAQRGLDALRLLHDVEIGEDVAARIDHKARARAFHRHGVEEEVVFDHAGDDIGHGWRGLAID